MASSPSTTSSSSHSHSAGRRDSFRIRLPAIFERFYDVKNVVDYNRDAWSATDLSVDIDSGMVTVKRHYSVPRTAGTDVSNFERPTSVLDCRFSALHSSLSFGETRPHYFQIIFPSMLRRVIFKCKSHAEMTHCLTQLRDAFTIQNTNSNYSVCSVKLQVSLSMPATRRNKNARYTVHIRVDEFEQCRTKPSDDNGNVKEIFSLDHVALPESAKSMAATAQVTCQPKNAKQAGDRSLVAEFAFKIEASLAAKTSHKFEIDLGKGVTMPGTLQISSDVRTVAVLPVSCYTNILEWFQTNTQNNLAKVLEYEGPTDVEPKVSHQELALSAARALSKYAEFEQFVLDMLVDEFGKICGADSTSTPEHCLTAAKSNTTTPRVLRGYLHAVCGDWLLAVLQSFARTLNLDQDTWDPTDPVQLEFGRRALADCWQYIYEARTRLPSRLRSLFSKTRVQASARGADPEAIADELVSFFMLRFVSSAMVDLSSFGLSSRVPSAQGKGKLIAKISKAVHKLFLKHDGSDDSPEWERVFIEFKAAHQSEVVEFRDALCPSEPVRSDSPVSSNFESMYAVSELCCHLWLLKPYLPQRDPAIKDLSNAIQELVDSMLPDHTEGHGPSDTASLDSPHGLAGDDARSLASSEGESLRSSAIFRNDQGLARQSALQRLHQVEQENARLHALVANLSSTLADLQQRVDNLERGRRHNQPRPRSDQLSHV